MTTYLPYKSKGSCAIAFCDRCGEKVYYDELISDGNSPGMKVSKNHPGCWDVKDPWRLPARKTENISLRHPRTDADVSINAADVTEVG